MKMKVIGVRNPGDLQNERVVIELLEDVEIGNYISFFSKDLGGEVISAKMLYPLWLPNKKLSAGDRVVIYSRDGEKCEKKTNEGQTVFFVYRGLVNAVCVTDKIRASLIEISDWETTGEVIL